MIYIASDHGGFNLKNLLITYLQAKRIDIVDCGPYEFVNSDDYPDYVGPLAVKVGDKPDMNKGIIICRNGVGVSILANKIKGVRCALSWNPQHAASTRNDDNSNVLALPADYISPEEAKKIVDTWLTTPFSGDPRHVRRLEKVTELENYK